MLSFEVAYAAHDWPTQKSVYRRRSKYSCIFGAENSAAQCLAFNERSLLQISPEIIYQWLSINRIYLSQVRPEKTLNIAQPHIRTLSQNNFFSPRTIWVDFYPAIKCPGLF